MDGLGHDLRGQIRHRSRRHAIFPANPKHNHASCVVETKEGNLLAAWYAGSGEHRPMTWSSKGPGSPREKRVGARSF